MNPFWSFQVIAKVLGNPALMVCALLVFGWIVRTVVGAEIPNWLRVLILGIFAVPMLGAIAWRLIRGGEQGSTDIMITETSASRTIMIGNLPLAHAPTELQRAMETFARMSPVPRPTGRVTGNPADAHAVILEAVPVDQPTPLPAGAKGLSSPQEADSEKPPTNT